jgi:uncharacterized protein (UPF0332 family)
VIETGLDDHAARTAYLACFHMARAYTFERTGRRAKTHRDVQSGFFRLSKDNPRSDPDLRASLTTAYHYKSTSDCETGPEDNPTPEEAREAVKTAERFIAIYAVLTPLPSPDPRAAESPQFGARLGSMRSANRK